MSKKGCCLLSAGVMLALICIGSIASAFLFQGITIPSEQTKETRLIIYTPTADEVSQELPIPITYATVEIEIANIYSGPSENYDVVRTVRQGAELPVFSIAENNKWLQVDNSSWINASSVSIMGKLSKIPGFVASTPQHAELDPTTTLPPATLVPAPEIIINVAEILNKTVAEVEAILGTATYVTPNDDNDDILAGGEYRDYEIGKYGFFVSFDRNGIAKGFQIMDGLSDEDYSLDDWGLLLPRFGLVIQSPPDESAPAALYWYDYQGYGIAVAAENMNGTPVWTVQIEDAGVFMK
jgi:hypothetical protein